MRKFIWLGFFIGSTLGGFVPSFWGDDMISVSGIIFSTIGGIAGIIAGYKVGKSLN